MVIFDDVNISAAVDWIMTGIFWGCGQVCSATSRVLVHQSIYQKVCDLLKQRSESLTVGTVGTREIQCPVDMGPLISLQQYSKVLKFFQIAEEEGLSTLTGGGQGRPNGMDHGYFVQPTIYTNVPVTSTLWKEEIFGPVLCLRAFSTEDEAVQLANDSEYGLAAAIMTRDSKRLKRLSNRLEAGMIWENCSQPVFEQQPFGGFKSSGFGRECGKEGVLEFMQVKTITSCHGDFCENLFSKV
eukprot:GHVS01096949.1.p1 GENE.GHVS01096949.1~~GHVS01096949.1.p1  ORF type:complete len:241 (-),score=10.03 GHVS01096949.1:184-906(-)